MPEPQHFDPPPWLDAQIDQLVARLEEVGAIEAAIKGNYEVIMVTLTEPASRAEAERWERTCDHCGRYCPMGDAFFSAQVLREVRGKPVVITTGFCPTCKP